MPNNCSLRTFLITNTHDSPLSGHFAADRTLYLLSSRWKWKEMRRNVDEYVSSCIKYQRAKYRNTKPPGQLHPILTSSPGKIIMLDLVSKFAPAAGTFHCQCIVITDKFSRFVMMEGCHMEVSAADVAQIFLHRVLPLFGVPLKVISDRGPQFSTALWSHLLQGIGSKAALGATHHPQTDGSSERAIQNLLRLIRTFAQSQQDQ